MHVSNIILVIHKDILVGLHSIRQLTMNCHSFGNACSVRLHTSTCSILILEHAQEVARSSSVTLVPPISEDGFISLSLILVIVCFQNGQCKINRKLYIS